MHPQQLADPDCDGWVRGSLVVVLSTPYSCKGCLWNPPDTMRTVLSLKKHQSKGTAAASMPRRLCCQAERNHATITVTRCCFSCNMVEMKGLLAFFSPDFPCLEFNNKLFFICDQNISLYSELNSKDFSPLAS